MHLPEELDTFIGREDELGELRWLVGTTRALTLRGPGGIGKTRLAFRLLASVAGDFPDGAWFAELADLRQPELVASRVAAVLGISEEPGRPLVETLADALRPQRFLLVLDTCEHLIDACAVLCRQVLASACGARLLITSREPLHIAGETIWEVPPLSTAPADKDFAAGDYKRYEAIRLFGERAAASRPGFAVGPENAAAISAICRAVDGLPLAIELAAAWVRFLPVEQIKSRLNDRFSLLTAGDRSAQPRQRTLRATIDWSYELLSAQESILFRRLSVFAGWSVEMAEQVCAGNGIAADDRIAPGDVLGLMAALADKSLVLVEPEGLGQARYRMLDTIREYAGTRLAEAGESQACRDKLRDYILRTAEDHLAVGMSGAAVPWRVRVECSRRYDTDSANVAGALSWCLARRDAEAGMRICVAVSPRWIAWGTFAEGGEWLDSFLALDVSSVAARVRGAVLVARAQLAMASDPIAAGSWAQAGLELCREAQEAQWTAAALNVLSEIALHTGQITEAAAHAQEALAVAQVAGDGWNQGYALGTRAKIAARAGKLTEAFQQAAASVSVMRVIDQQWGAARALLGLGDVARTQGRPGEAHGRYVEALPTLREIGARPEIARCLAGLGRVAMDLGALEQARRHLAGSLELSRATGTRLGIARGLEAFALLAVQENLPERAVRLAGAAAALRHAAGLPLPAVRTQAYLAPARHLGDAAIARLWAAGLATGSEEAIAIAIGPPVQKDQKGQKGDPGPALTVVDTVDTVDSAPGRQAKRPDGASAPP